MGKQEFHPAFGNNGSTGAGGGGNGSIEVSFPDKPPQANLSFVEDHEQLEAQSLIDNQFRELTKCPEYPAGITLREHFRLTRYFAAVKIYVRPEELKEITREDGTIGKLYLPDSVRAEDRYQSCTGVVVALGPQTFKDKDGNPRGSLYRLADWILFPRTDIIRVDFCGVPLGILTDDRAIAVVSDPTHWAQGSVTYKA